jgi:RNA-binding protein YhbY
MVLVIDLHQLVAARERIAFSPRPLHIGVVDVLTQPGIARSTSIHSPKPVKMETSKKVSCMLNLSSDERRALRARAHSLHPVVSISHRGLSESVVKEINASLASHGLIKIRVYHDDRKSESNFFRYFVTSSTQRQSSISENCW